MNNPHNSSNGALNPPETNVSPPDYQNPLPERSAPVAINPALPSNIARAGGIPHQVTPRYTHTPVSIPTTLAHHQQQAHTSFGNGQVALAPTAVPLIASQPAATPDIRWTATAVPNPLAVAVNSTQTIPAPRALPYTTTIPTQPHIPGQPRPKPKVVLSPEARQALAKAIWSAIRSPDGCVSEVALNEAVATGLPKHAILNAAKVAREREAQKRKVMAPIPMVSAPPNPVQHPPVVVAKPVVHDPPPAPPPAPKPAPPPVSKPPPKPAIPPPPSIQQIKADERNLWKRVHAGIFTQQKGRYIALPNSISTIVRTNDNRSNLVQGICKRPRPDIIKQAILLQAQLRTLPKADSPLQSPSLLDPDKLKRIKIEPKRIAKALDRAVKKNRAVAVESLLKQHKEVSKAILCHSTEFFKFHKFRRAEAKRMASAVRDRFSKEEKKKEKDTEQAERARLAALRANDMQAYSQLLEETKNQRLKFLLEKTDECITQISSLLQERSTTENNAAEFANASSAKTGSYYASAHLKMEEVRQPGILVGGELKDYQLGGLQWMVSLYNNKLNGILADEMGLGKTIQAIALVAYLMEFKENLGPYLIIVPLSTLSNWCNEIAKWCPAARTVIYKGTPGQRKDLYRDEVRNGHFNILLTTYEYIIKDKSSLKKITWQYAIVDEGHRMKNAQSKFAVTLGTQYTTKNRILLTGTPLQNSLPELWALLNFLLPTIFNSVESFDQWFNRPFSQFSNTAGSEQDQTDQMLNTEERMLIIHRLHELLRPFMLRRVKSEVLDQLPEKVEKVLRCELSSWQKELYKQISAKAQEDKSLMGSFVQEPTRGLNNVVMQLRKVCNHPYLFSPEGYHINDNIIRSSGKMELLDRMLPKLKAAGHRVLMFTQMTAVMTILEDYFAYRGYTSLRLDGSTPADEREKRMYKFNAPDSPYFIFLLSTRAGGLGLNLATANSVIIFDSDWNPMMDLQAMDRSHRIGQRSDVSVFRLITYSPVEEKILSRATEKLNMSELVVEAGKFDKSSVEQDNSLERKKMMEVLLTDFDTQTNANSKIDIGADPSESGDEDDDGEDMDEKGEDLNELLSNNEGDFQLYSKLDSDCSRVFSSPGLYVSQDDVPDWIKYPNGKDAQDTRAIHSVDGSRKRKDVAYDDGLTEKQFLRIMDKQLKDEEENLQKRKVARMSNDDPPGDTVAVVNPGAPGELTDWTFRKLISAVKTVIALKDPATKRRLSEIFLEKPSPDTYPDYYAMITKPIAINDILRKCRAQLYSNLHEFWDDWKLLFANAKQFNGEESWVTNDSMSLQRELERFMKKNGLEDQPPQPPKKKPLRIKLSLKLLKPKEDTMTNGDESVKRKKGKKTHG